MKPENLDLNQIENLFKSYYKTLCNVVNRIVKDRDASEDIVQDVFIKLWKKKDQISIDSTIKGYLFKAVTNAALNYLEKNKGFKFKVEINDKTHAAYVSEEPNLLDQQELEAKIEGAINSLPPKCRAIFVLSRFEEMKYQEIADHLNISIKTVENQMGIALEKLRQALKSYIKGELMIWPILIVLSSFF